MRTGKLLFTFIIWILFGCFSLALGADKGEIRPAETKTGNLKSFDSYQDSWTFYGDADDRVVITTARISGGVEPCIFLYPPGGGPLENSNCGNSSGISLDTQLQETGLYTIIVRDYQLNEEGEYGIALAKIPGAATSPVDPDGGPIASGETLPGTLSLNADTDIYQFYGDAGDRVVITTARISGGVEPCISLYPPDSGPLENSNCGNSSGIFLDTQLQETGLYTIIVSDYQLNEEGEYGIALAKIPGAATSPVDPDGGPIASGETLAGTLSLNADTDIYQFYGDAGDRVVITTARISGGVEPCISLYPPDGGPLENSNCGNSSGISLDTQLQETGLYTIIVSDYQLNEEGEYGIALAKIPGAATSPVDPDGGPIASGETLAGTLSLNADTDIYQFYGDAGDRVVITTARISGGVEPCISLYPPDGGPLENSNCGNSSGISLDTQLQETGLYTIIVSDYQLNEEGEYGIALAKIPGAATSPLDPDGGSIASGETLPGTLSLNADTDIYQFYGDAGDRVVITTARISGGVEPCISLYPPDGGPLENSNCGNSSGISLDTQLQETGLYTIIVSDYQLNEEGGYSTSLTKIPSTLRPGIYNPFPSNGESISDLSDFFTWDPVSGATRYDLYFGENVIEPLDLIGNTSSPSMPFPAMDTDKVYYWHVVAHTSVGDIEGPYWWFKTTGKPLLYTPVTPCRIVDTRNTSAGIIDASTQRNFRVFGPVGDQGGDSFCPSPGGEPYAAHINMVAVNPTGKGNLQAFPVGAGAGAGLSVNYNTIDTNLANAGTVKSITGTGPDITVASNFSSAHTVLDVLGYYYREGDSEEELLYTPVTPCRIVDTRNTSAGIIDASTQRNFRVFGPVGDQGGDSFCPSPGGVPFAAHINMVAVNPTGKGNLQAFPVGAGAGAGLSANYNTIDTNLANAGTVKSNRSTAPDITVASNFSSAHTAIDILGYYYREGDSEEELLYIPVTPCRIVDTRKTSAGVIDASTQRDFRVFGPVGGQGGNSAGCPSPGGEPYAAHINMVAVNPTGKGNLQAFPADAEAGAGLSVNYNTIDTNLANAGTVKTITGTGPDITVASNFSSAHTVLDVLGYYYRAPGD